MEQNNDQDQMNHVRGAVEALLFVNEHPVSLDQIKKIFDTVSAAEIKQIIGVLQKDYEESKKGLTIVEIAGGYQMFSNPIYVSYLRKFYKTKHKEKLSKPALETLAIIAYKQPVTRAEIELIRGVNSDGVVSHLCDKELIKIVGRKDVPGRPFLYGTTKQFMEYFGLRSLEDLPKLEEFPALLDKKQKENEQAQAEESEEENAPSEEETASEASESEQTQEAQTQAAVATQTETATATVEKVPTSRIDEVSRDS